MKSSGSLVACCISFYDRRRSADLCLLSLKVNHIDTAYGYTRRTNGLVKADFYSAVRAAVSTVNAWRCLELMAMITKDLWKSSGLTTGFREDTNQENVD